MNAAEFLEIYEAIAGITGCMRLAAQGEQWDTVIRLEEECRRQVDRIRALPELPRLSEESRRRHFDFVRRVLEDDAAIRRLAQPRMAALLDLIDSSARRRRLCDAYAAPFG